MNKIHNKNTNIQQIIFPVGYELRKIEKKKPKKKKGVGMRRKKALDELKSTLQQYDTLINEAEENKINIPKELGELHININEINTINEIESLTADLRERIKKIAELISTETRQKKAINMFGSMPQNAGVFPTPQPFNFTPTVIPRPSPYTPFIPSPLPTPAPKADKEEIDKTDEQLDKITKEIESKLSPEQREEAERKRKELLQKKAIDIMKEGQREGREQEQMGQEDKDAPTSEKYKVDNRTFRLTKAQPEDMKILGEQFIDPVIDIEMGDPNSGTSLYDEFKKIRTLIIKVRKKLNKDPENPDEWTISNKDIQDLRTAQKGLRSNYEYFISKLNPQQLESIDDVVVLKRMNDYIEKVLIQPISIIGEEEINSEEGRKTTKVIVIDNPDKPIKPSLVKPELDADVRPSSSSSTSTSSDDDVVAGGDNVLTIAPARRKPQDYKFFDTLLDYITKNKNNVKVTNYSKTITTAVKNLFSAVTEAETSVRKAESTFKPKYTSMNLTDVAFNESVKRGGQKERNDRIRDLIFYWDKITGMNPINLINGKLSV